MALLEPEDKDKEEKPSINPLDLAEIEEEVKELSVTKNLEFYKAKNMLLRASKDQLYLTALRYLLAYLKYKQDADKLIKTQMSQSLGLYDGISDEAETVIYRSPGGFLEVVKTAHNFFFARRKGINSVAIFLIRLNEEDEWEVMMRMQPLCVSNAKLNQRHKLFHCPITGSMEPSDPKMFRTTALKEVEEEGGYTLDSEELVFLTSYFVGTQTDEEVAVYVANVTGKQPKASLGDGGQVEKASHNKWIPLDLLPTYKYVANKVAYPLIKDMVERDRLQRSDH